MRTRELTSRVLQARCQGYAPWINRECNASSVSCNVPLFRGSRGSRYMTAALNPSMRQPLQGLANPAIAFPLNAGHLARPNIGFEGTEVADAGFPSLERHFVVTR